MGLLIFAMSIPTAWAQEDSFNPENPPEPQENLRYRVSVVSNPAEAASVSGIGQYF